MLHFYFTKVTIYHHHHYHRHYHHHFHHYHYHYNHHHHFHHHYYKYASIQILLDMIHYTSLIDAENNECLKYDQILRVEGDVVARNNRRSVFSYKMSGLSDAKDTITSSSSLSPSSSLPSSLLLFKDNFKLFNLLLTNYAISHCNDKYSNNKKEASSISLSAAASATSPMKKEGLSLIQAFLYEVIHNITYDRTIRTLLQYDDEIDWNKPSRVNPNPPSSSSIDPNADVFEIGSPRHLIEALLTWNITSDRELQQKQRNRSEGKFMTSIADDDDDANGNDGTNMTSDDIYMVRLCVITWV
jgi:hypothetical protein